MRKVCADFKSAVILHGDCNTNVLDETDVKNEMNVKDIMNVKDVMNVPNEMNVLNEFHARAWVSFSLSFLF